MPPVSRSAVQTTPARPTISPLSTTSKTLKSSPIATRDAKVNETMAEAHEEAIETSEDGDAEAGEHLDDRSSSLSEPEDDNEDVEDEHAPDEDALNGEDAAAHQLLDYDSEATTERLEQTPQKLRKHADSTGRTPSKLNQASTTVDELSEPPSPVPTGVGAASSTSTVATAGQKRKRSETADSSLTSADSDIGESPRKKTHEMPSNALEDDAEEALEHVEQSTENVDHAEDTPAAEDTRDTPVVPAKPAKGRGKAKHWKTKRKEALLEAERQATEDAMEAAEEPSEEKEAKTEEEIKAKKEASSTYEDVYKQFRFFREKLNTEQLAALTSELALLSPSNPTHPEYLKQVACVDARLQKQKSEAHAFYNYRMKSIRQRTLGERSQRHSQYYQSIRELREDVLYDLGQTWHEIQKERRQVDEEQPRNLFVSNEKAQKKIQAEYNHELSILSGVAKYVGWPSAPEIKGVNNFEDDLRAMGISKRTQQAPAAARALSYAGPSISSIEARERLAQEKFAESTPWARAPAVPTHSLGAIHTPEWNSAGNPGRALLRTLSGHVQRMSSPFATPMAQNRPLGEHHSSAGTVPMNSDGAEPPSSIVPAPPTTSRIDLINQASSNQTSPITFPKHRTLGQNGPELTGFRNISGISAISGASTIDAPQETEQSQARQTEAAAKAAGMPALAQALSASHSVFDTSQLHRHARDEREVYQNVGFRPQEGAYGTPAPLPPRDSGP